MTDQQPPQDRPEFQPPGGDPAGEPPPPSPPAQPPTPSAPMPTEQQPYAPPQQQQPYAAPQQQPYAPPAQPGSYPQFSAPAQPGTYPQFQPPPQQPAKGRGSIWLGIGITVAALLASWALTSVRYDSPFAQVASLLAAGLPFALVLGGIVMAAIPRTTRTGAGILIGIGAGILIAGGLCFALLIGFGAFGG